MNPVNQPKSKTNKNWVLLPAHESERIFLFLSDLKMQVIQQVSYSILLINI